jgi:cell division protein FtsN
VIFAALRTVKIETAMRKLVFFAVIGVLALGSCKSSKKAATTPYTPASQQEAAAPAVPPKVFTVPESKPAPTQPVAEEKPVTVRQEAITFTQPEEQTTNSYFIITGSFSNMDNAKNFRQTLISEGFTPIIVQSETGYYRVTVDSYSNEAAARERLLQIRQNYPKYADTWLLIKK